MDTFSNAESSKKDGKDAGEQYILKLCMEAAALSPWMNTASLHTNEQSGEVLWVLPFSLQAFLPEVLQHSNIHTELITR